MTRSQPEAKVDAPHRCPTLVHRHPHRCHRGVHVHPTTDGRFGTRPPGLRAQHDHTDNSCSIPPPTTHRAGSGRLRRQQSPDRSSLACNQYLAVQLRHSGAQPGGSHGVSQEQLPVNGQCKKRCLPGNRSGQILTGRPSKRLVDVSTIK